MRVHVMGIAEGVSLIALIHGYPVSINGYGDISRFDTVARTLRAIDVQAGPRNFSCSLAYSDGGRLYCLGAGGAPVPIADAAGAGTLRRPAISFDGHWVAYAIDQTDGASELWAVDVRGLTGGDGLNLPRRLLVRADQIGYGDPNIISAPLNYQWQGDTHNLYFNTRFTLAGGNLGPGEYVHNDLWKVNVDSGEVANLLGRDSAGQFYLSPDGLQVAIANPQSVALAGADGSSLRRLLEFPAVSTYSESQFRPKLVWGPASDSLVVLIPSADPRAPDASGTMYRLGVDGSVQKLATIQGNFLFGAELDSDGTFLAYQTSDAASGAVTLHVVRTDGTGDTILAQGSGLNGLGWARLNAVYAYSLRAAGQNFVTTPDGRPLPFGPDVEVVEVRWVSPESLYFSGTADGQWGLFFYALGQPTISLVTGLSDVPAFDARP